MPPCLRSPLALLTLARPWVLAASLPLWAVFPVHAAPDTPKTEPVTLQLKWLHQFQFAGYYAAQAQGFYRDEGLEVTIREGGAERPVLAAVLGGEAQYGIGDSDLLIHRINGQPVVALAAIFQHSPYVIVSRADRQIRVPSDLIGRRVMLSDDQGGIQLRAMLQSEGMDPRSVDIVAQSWKIEDLIEGRVDAVSAYATVEPALLRARGVTPSIMRSLDYGVDFYGDILFTTQAQIDKSPERSAAFVRATRRGWDHAFKHEVEMAELILQMPGVRERGLNLAVLIGEAAQMRPLVLPDLVEIGHLNPGRLDAIARTLARLGLVRANYSLAGLIHEPGVGGVPASLLRWLGLAAGLLLSGATGVLLWNMQMRRRVRERTQALQAEISNRTEVQQQLKASQDMVQLMFGTAAAGMVMNTPDGHFLMANPAYHALLGYNEGELRAMDTRDLTHPDDRERYAGLRERMFAGEFSFFSDEKRYLKKGGTSVWVHSTVSLVRSATGQATHVISVTEDVTARRAIEEKLRSSEVLLRIAGRTARIGGWMMELPSEKVSWSDEVCAIHDMPPGSAPTLQQALGFYLPASREKIQQAVQDCMQHGTPFDEELEIHTASGRQLCVRVIGELVRDERGQRTRIHGSTQDVTEHKQAQASILRLNAELEERVRQRTAQLQAANQELEAFSYSVSHDLRSPLSTVDGFSQLMERTYADQVGDKGQHYLRRIRAGARQMGELIEGLLSLAKLARDPLRAGHVDLAAMTRQVVQECREREPDRQVEVQLQQPLLAHGDPLLLSVVIQNLVGNAWKFTARQPAPRIAVGSETGPNGDTVYFVKDNGAGFDMAYVDKLFGTFHRLHTSAEYPGTGVGLATVQRIIFRHGGKVWAQAAEGEGATFYFTLEEAAAESVVPTA